MSAKTIGLKIWWNGYKFVISQTVRAGGIDEVSFKNDAMSM